jgi:hypothetical protein
MTIDERRIRTLKLVALGKAYNEYSTHLIKELKMQTKMDFNHSVKAINTFVNTIEGKYTADEVALLEEITDVILHNLEL